jgi:hypothetical protein
MKTKKAYNKKKARKNGRKIKNKTQKGGAYGATMNSLANNAKSNMGFGYSGPVKYNHCGGSKGVAIFNNRIGYGYTNEGAADASTVQGGYAPVSRYVSSQCGAGKKGKKAKKGKSKKNKTRKSRKHLKIKSLKKKKGKKRNTMKKGKKHHQKGGSGYSQYQSNTPIGTSFESPNVTPPHNALGPMGITKTNINCVDNYNHYKK